MMVNFEEEVYFNLEINLGILTDTVRSVGIKLLTVTKCLINYSRVVSQYYGHFGSDQNSTINLKQSSTVYMKVLQ